ncbi:MULTISPECIES: hypothetical protein [unclassified Streptomyces]|uniref:hypothetical protein n=1 Tax=unclassified Streptomyces TaxID=2593676 RepID=UPI00225233A7|nr:MULTISPECIES: hypothetical protein [unclassified Streptomyces]WSP53101.1 hypothetical protein OG306_00550 [Streptomyces sp. NBC_01241]WSU26182.1 hypothetical protein OG508_38475 [Streptomyces sp. NBC_01108]WTE35655.1 hypothetical protein OH735_22435 [Streptomyces sp. NBC_01618]MCX4791741.1 hypothetical protein [Streptomyces sp. NBC_01221]MCX4799425.1 hypothetical protein [Streptomyces sp. NBC_01242]
MIRLSGPLLGPLIRAIDWIPVATAAAVTIVLALATTPGSAVEPDNAAITLRMSGVLLGAASSFALVDPAEVTTTVVPVPRWLRQWLRLLLVAAATAVVWAGTFLILSTRLAEGAEMAAPGLMTEAAVCVLTGLACTAFVVRRRPERLAAVAGAAVLLGIAVSTVPWFEEVWPYPGSARWDQIHHVWLAVLPVPVAALVLAHREVSR